MPKNKHWIPLTYAPKIPGVLDGTIRQTIRTGRIYRVGNQIAFHGWAGVPYRSPWSFRTGYLTLKEVLPIVIYPHGIAFPSVIPLPDEYPIVWLWSALGKIARLDGIVPATGTELGRVLASYHAIPEEGVEAQILRW